MTTDITELAQSLKAAANTTADAIDRLKVFPGDELIDLSQHEGEQVDIDITTLNEWYELSSPANILALVEALEKAQQVDEELCKLLPPGAEYMDPPDGGDVTPLEGVRRMVADYRQRIAELESHAVTDWIEHDGKWRPDSLSTDELVYLKTRKQELKIPYPAGKVMGLMHTGGDMDVMAYKLASPQARTVTVKLPKDHVDDADLFGWGVVVVPLEALKDACANAGVTVEIADDGIKVEAE